MPEINGNTMDNQPPYPDANLTAAERRRRGCNSLILRIQADLTALRILCGECHQDDGACDYRACAAAETTVGRGGE